MKSDLTKLSLALLSAVFILGCQDLGSGPVEAVDLEPQFNSPFSGPCIERHCHGDEADVEVPRYTIIFTLDSDIFGVDEDGNRVDEEEDPLLFFTNQPLGHVTVKPFQMDITVLLQAGWGVTCGGEPLPVVADKVILTGIGLSLTPFANPQLLFRFEHNGAEHYVQSLSDVGETRDWYPTAIGQMVPVKDLNGQWEITTTGKNHRFGCTGEGGPDTKNPDNTINWTAKVTRIS